MAREIIIVGAGICGLSAARELAAAGLSVTVLEGRDRIGGRIHTMKEAGFSMPTEAGAEFVHGKPERTLALMEKAGIRQVRQEGRIWEVRNGILRRTEIFPESLQAVSAALHQLDDDMSMMDFLNRFFPRERFGQTWEDVRHIVEGFDAADMDKISALAVREEWSGEDEFSGSRIAGGYSLLCDFLRREASAMGAAFRLSAVVREVAWRRGRVNVMTTDGESLEAGHLLMTVPAAVLRSGTIRFTPPAPSWQNALQKIETGGVIKFLTEFRTSFWESPAGTVRPVTAPAFIFSDAAIPTWWTQRPDQRPLLTGWLSGRATRNAPGPTLFGEAVRSLAYLFACTEEYITGELKAWQIVDWLRDPFSLGAYAYKTPQTADALKILTTPVDDTIFLAGEAFNTGDVMGTVEAALQSSANAVRCILQTT